MGSTNSKSAPTTSAEKDKIYQVIVKGIRGEKVTIDLCSTEEQMKSMTVLQLKEKIAQKLPKISDDQQRLVFSGKQMEDGRTLSYYGITDGSAVHLLFRGRQGVSKAEDKHHKMVAEIEVRSLIGKILTITLPDGPEHTTVEELKCKIQDREGIPWNQQRLIFSRYELWDEAPLSYYGITDGSTVHLVLKLSGGGKVPEEDDGIGDKDDKHRMSMERLHWM